MKILLPSLLLSFALTTALVTSASLGADPVAAAAVAPNTVCPVSGKPVDPKITCVYEDVTYAFADDASRTKFEADRAASLYQQIGGKAAIEAAVELFYVKVLADDRVKHFFDDVSMVKQKRKQKEFLSYALGGPVKYTGKDLRKAHADMHLTETHFAAIAEHLQATLTELKVPQDMIARAMAIVATTKDAVLNRPVPSQAAK